RQRDIVIPEKASCKKQKYNKKENIQSDRSGNLIKNIPRNTVYNMKRDTQQYKNEQNKKSVNKGIFSPFGLIFCAFGKERHCKWNHRENARRQKSNQTSKKSKDELRKVTVTFLHRISATICQRIIEIQRINF